MSRSWKVSEKKKIYINPSCQRTNEPCPNTNQTVLVTNHAHQPNSPSNHPEQSTHNDNQSTNETTNRLTNQQTNKQTTQPTNPQVIDLDTQWRECRSRIDFLNKDKNRFQKEVTKAKKAGQEDAENAARIVEVVKEVKVVEVALGERPVMIVCVAYQVSNGNRFLDVMSISDIACRISNDNSVSNFIALYRSDNRAPRR